jgi:hypothetical protein
LTQFDAGYVLPRAGKVKVWFYPFLALGAAELALKRKLSLSVSRMWQWGHHAEIRFQLVL